MASRKSETTLDEASSLRCIDRAYANAVRRALDRRRVFARANGQIGRRSPGPGWTVCRSCAKPCRRDYLSNNKSLRARFLAVAALRTGGHLSGGAQAAKVRGRRNGAKWKRVVALDGVCYYFRWAGGGWKYEVCWTGGCWSEGGVVGPIGRCIYRRWC